MSFTVSEIDTLFDPTITSQALYRQSGGMQYTITVVFSKAYQMLNILDGGIGVDSTSPIAICRTNDIPMPQIGETLEVDNTTYYITGVQPDGSGLTTIILSETAANA